MEKFALEHVLLQVSSPSNHHNSITAPQSSVDAPLVCDSPDQAANYGILWSEGSSRW
jgi:hypothetical protein